MNTLSTYSSYSPELNARGVFGDPRASLSSHSYSSYSSGIEKLQQLSDGANEERFTPQPVDDNIHRNKYCSVAGNAQQTVSNREMRSQSTFEIVGTSREVRMDERNFDFRKSLERTSEAGSDFGRRDLFGRDAKRSRRTDKIEGYTGFDVSLERDAKRGMKRTRKRKRSDKRT